MKITAVCFLTLDGVPFSYKIGKETAKHIIQNASFRYWPDDDPDKGRTVSSEFYVDDLRPEEAWKEAEKWLISIGCPVNWMR